MKIIKYSLIAALGAALLPSPPDNQFVVASTGERIDLQTGQVLSAAASAYSDFAGFCERQPAVCDTAGKAWRHLEVKAKYNFKLVYEWSRGASEQNDEPLPPIRIQHTSAADPIITGSVRRQTITVSSADTPKGTNTLSIEDVIPEWRGPVSTG